MADQVEENEDDDDDAVVRAADSKRTEAQHMYHPNQSNVLYEGVDDEDNDSQQPLKNNHPQIDLVLYLQQTGSIIALSKLMDALEYGGEDYDEALDEYERKMIREQQLMRGQ
jgi:hypothetical protein